MSDCRWSNPNTEAFPGAMVPPGRIYSLASGLMEITYINGAKVILEGPCTYQVDSSNSGYLSAGKLTVRVEKKAVGNPPFFFRTPNTIITDLSAKSASEFGIETSKKGYTLVHVFRGSVRLQVADGGPPREVALRENESARVETEADGGLRLISLGVKSQKLIDMKTPLSDPGQAQVDKELLGVWRSEKSPRGVKYILVGRGGGKLPPGVMRAVSCTQKDDGTLSRPSEWLMFASVDGEHRYMNVLAAKDENPAQLDQPGWRRELVEGYMLVKYRVKGDSLVAWTVDSNVKLRLIKTGKIKGTINKVSAMFTDDADNLKKLLASPEGAELFNEKSEVRYQRVK